MDAWSTIYFTAFTSIVPPWGKKVAAFFCSSKKDAEVADSRYAEP